MLFIAIGGAQFFPDRGDPGGHAGPHPRRQSDHPLDQVPTFFGCNEVNAHIDRQMCSLSATLIIPRRPLKSG